MHVKLEFAILSIVCFMLSAYTRVSCYSCVSRVFIIPRVFCVQTSACSLFHVLYFSLPVPRNLSIQERFAEMSSEFLEDYVSRYD